MKSLLLWQLAITASVAIVAVGSDRAFAQTNIPFYSGTDANVSTIQFDTNAKGDFVSNASGNDLLLGLQGLVSAPGTVNGAPVNPQDYISIGDNYTIGVFTHIVNAPKESTATLAFSSLEFDESNTQTFLRTGQGTATVNVNYATDTFTWDSIEQPNSSQASFSGITSLDFTLDFTAVSDVEHTNENLIGKTLSGDLESAAPESSSGVVLASLLAFGLSIFLIKTLVRSISQGKIL